MDRGGAADLMSAIEKRRMIVQIIPRMSLRFPPTISSHFTDVYVIELANRRSIPSGPMLVSLTPLEEMKPNAILTFSAICTFIRGFLLYRPREVSPENNDK